MNRSQALIVIAATLAYSASTATANAANLAPAAKTCRTAAPTTAPGYAAMFAKVNPLVWGAADTALSVHLPGKAVWLYSDTASGPNPRHWTKFAHNTAITQVAGCLHVSRSGAQVIPNDGDRFYWIDSGRPIDASHIRVTGFEMSWATRATTGRFRDAQLSVSAAGDVLFQRWLGYRTAPAPSSLVKDAGLMGNSVSYHGSVICSDILQPGPEYTYSPQLHPELRLASGKTLLSLAVGWSSGTPRWQDMRPIYREVTP